MAPFSPSCSHQSYYKIALLSCRQFGLKAFLGLFVYSVPLSRTRDTGNGASVIEGSLVSSAREGCRMGRY